jgi:hypothetical protein
MHLLHMTCCYVGMGIQELPVSVQGKLDSASMHMTLQSEEHAWQATIMSH